MSGRGSGCNFNPPGTFAPTEGSKFCAALAGLSAKLTSVSCERRARAIFSRCACDSLSGGVEGFCEIAGGTYCGIAPGVPVPRCWAAAGMATIKAKQRHNRKYVACVAPSMRFAGCGGFAFEIVLAARLVQRRCIGDGVGQRFGETAVAPIVHVKPVRRKECLERESLMLVPIAHEGEAMKHVDFFLRGGARDQIDH